MGTYIQQAPAQYYRPVQQRPIQQPVQQTPGQVGQYPGQVGQHPGQRGHGGYQNNAAAGAFIGGLIGLGIGAFLGVASAGIQFGAYCPPGRGGYPGQGPGQGPGQYPGQYPGQSPRQGVGVVVT